ncbi:cullin like protein [Nosema bombycis CQ1]|uniref:Cullin like protein n=1 Tax=Nosema bombycis (strain CQ1 / CVCC 102059) TaxID=578461 RepID=R0MHF9_NOSB1|nr:cullin like protein [Nosema bombycis CQ1]|eukprot:EOB13585.1 cullin like protein [Nosema bombycis CQ1]
MNFLDLEKLSLKVLESPDDFISDDFIAIYNFVYQHCTQKSDVFIVQGIEVYDTLKKVITLYSDSLKPITSLKSFNILLLRFEHSLKILSNAFSYLERYYIKSCINIRDGHTQDITSLGYTILYSNYLSNYSQRIKDLLLYEINFQRKVNKPKYEIIRTATDQLRNILLYNDLEKEYEDLMGKYYRGFYRIVMDKDILKVILLTKREIKHSRNFFGRVDLQKLTICVSKRFKEVIELFCKGYSDGKGIKEYCDNGKGIKDNEAIERVMVDDNRIKVNKGVVNDVKVVNEGATNEKVITDGAFNDNEANIPDFNNKIFLPLFFSSLIVHMKEDHISLFLSSLNRLISEDLKCINSIEDLVLFCINTSVMLKSIPLGTSEIQNSIKQHVEKVLLNTDHVLKLSSIIEEIRTNSNPKINSMMRSKEFKDISKEFILEIVMKIIKISYLHEEILKKIILNIQQRLLDFCDYEAKGDYKGEGGYKNNIKAEDSESIWATIENIKKNNYNKHDHNKDYASSFDKKIIDSIEKIFGVSYISWLKIAIDRFLKPFSQSFGLKNQNEDLKTEIRLLTKGFWDVPFTSLNLHPTLKEIELILIKQNLLLYPRSEISPMYRVSPVTFTLNNIDIRVSTDLLSLILYFTESDSLDLVKEKSKDVNFDENLQKLIKNEIILEKDGKLILNYDFKSQKPFLNLFNVEFETLTPNLIQSPSNHIETAIEAFCIRKLKKLKRIPERNCVEK